MAWPLPPELTGRIVSLLENPLTHIDTKLGLAQYASVNRDWQSIVEERSWAKLRVKTGTPLNLHQFERLTNDLQRQSYVRDIELIVELEPYDEAARAHFETESEYERNNQIFCEAIRSVLQILAKWRSSHSISLSIKVQSPSDLIATPKRLRRIKAARGYRTADILNRRFERNYLRLDAFESQIAPISIVHTLKIDALGNRRQIEATSCARLTSKFPNLHTLKLLLNDTCKRDKALRKRNRDEFAAHMHLLPPSIKNFYFLFNYAPPMDHNFSPDDITDQGVDALSLRMHKFSQQLKTLRIDGMTFGNELFWPPESNHNNPLWPDLRTIEIDYIPTTPCGKWLFVDRSDREEYDNYESEDSDPHDEWPEYVRTVLEDRSDKPFREVSVPGLFNELYMAVGRAALSMPKLENLRMDTESGRVHHRFRYSTEGEVCATWSDRLGFQPEEMVLDLWKKVASENAGQSLTVKLCDN